MTEGPFTESESSYAAWLIKVLRIREFEWHQYQSGILDGASWNSYMRPVPTLFASATAKRILDWYGGDPEFTTYLHRYIDENSVDSA